MLVATPVVTVQLLAVGLCLGTDKKLLNQLISAFAHSYHQNQTTRISQAQLNPTTLSEDTQKLAG